LVLVVFLNLWYVQSYMDAVSARTIKYAGHKTCPSTHLVKWQFLSVQKGASFWLLSGFGFCSPWRYPYRFCCPELCWNQQFSSFSAVQKCQGFLQLQVLCKSGSLGKSELKWLSTQWEENVACLTKTQRYYVQQLRLHGKSIYPADQGWTSLNCLSASQEGIGLWF